jgi:hypothetical protein
MIFYDESKDKGSLTNLRYSYTNKSVCFTFCRKISCGFHTYILTTCSTVNLEKLTSVQLVNTFPHIV